MAGWTVRFTGWLLAFNNSIQSSPMSECDRSSLIRTDFAKESKRPGEPW